MVEIKDVDGPLDDFVDEKIDCLEASIDEESKMASNFKLKNYIATFGQIFKMTFGPTLAFIINYFIICDVPFLIGLKGSYNFCIQF